MKSTNFLKRMDKVRSHFEEWEVQGALIENPCDLFYLTGLQLSVGTCLITEKKAHLLVDGRYFAAAQKNSPCQVHLTSTEALTSLLKPLKQLAFDSRFTSCEKWHQLKKIFPGKLAQVIQPLNEVRAIKEQKELAAMKKSAALAWRGFEETKRQLKVGITEKELALKFEMFCRAHGAEKMAFDPIIAFGKNSAYPHYRPGDVKLKKGDIVLIDIGVVVDKYHSDMTRTVFFGKPDPRLVLIETVVKEAHAAALKLCKPGAKVEDLDLAARRVAEKAGLKDLLVHSLGHGIGLETHEFPRLSFQGEDRALRLKAGMCITIEPGLYLPGVGGVRYEDTVVVTEKGYHNFYG
jgi:Xaa-Pro aminopeptidase